MIGYDFRKQGDQVNSQARRIVIWIVCGSILGCGAEGPPPVVKDDVRQSAAPLLVGAAATPSPTAAPSSPSSSSTASAATYEPQVGDILFQSLPHAPLVDVIEAVTQSPYSHCGIVDRFNDKRFLVVEAIGPTVETELPEWLARGRNGGFVVYRLDPKYADKLPAVLASARKHMGKPYDVHYDLDDAKIYCSELIFKAFRDATGEQLGTIRKLGDLNWKPNEAFIRYIESGGLPLEREMITPKDLAEAKQLREVYRFGM